MPIHLQCLPSAGVGDGPMLFVVFINDIDSFVVSSLLKFADDTKTLRQVPEVEYVFTLQEDLHSMYKWSQD